MASILYSLRIIINLKHGNSKLKSVLRSDNSIQILNIELWVITKLNVHWKLKFTKQPSRDLLRKSYSESFLEIRKFPKRHPRRSPVLKKLNVYSPHFLKNCILSRIFLEDFYRTVFLQNKHEELLLNLKASLKCSDTIFAVCRYYRRKTT